MGRKKYNELPTIQQVLSGGANAAAAAKAALGLAITAWEEKKAELARVDLEIEGHKLTIKGLEAKWHFGAIIIRGKITAAQLALATAVTVAAGLRIVVDDLFNKVSECRVSLKLAIEGGISGGCDIAGAVELAGIKVAELAAQTALGAAELALAAPKAAFDLAVCAFAKIKAAFKLGVAFVTRCLYALTDAATFMLNGISGGIKVGGVQELHLRASMRFMGVKLSVSVDVNFSEIGQFIAAIVAALIEVIHKKLFSFGCNLSIEAEYLD